MKDPPRVYGEAMLALRPVLGSGRPERFKVLTVACPNDHVVARVYRTARGLVLLFTNEGIKGERAAETADALGVLMPIYGPRGDVTALWLEDELLAGAYKMQCRCGTVEPDTTDLLASIEDGKRRHRVSHSAQQ